MKYGWIKADQASPEKAGEYMVVKGLPHVGYEISSMMFTPEGGWNTHYVAELGPGKTNLDRDGEKPNDWVETGYVRAWYSLPPYQLSERVEVSA